MRVRSPGWKGKPMRRWAIFPGVVLFVTALLGNSEVCEAVDAGPGQVIMASRLPVTVQLAGVSQSCSKPHWCYQRWGKLSGPGTVTFADEDDPQTAATFSSFGVYTLRLTYAFIFDYYTDLPDQPRYEFDDVLIEIQGLTVNECPEVYAGADIEMDYYPLFIRMGGMAYDPDSGPDASAKPVWRKVSGPGDVGFVNPHDLKTQVTFSKPGEYVLELYYYDGQCEDSDRVIVKLGDQFHPVGSPPLPPSTPDLDSASDTGVSNTDNVTSDNTPTFSGTAEAGCSVTLYSDGIAVGSGIATGGSYRITTSVLVDGVRSITARATDTYGDTSNESGALNVNIQTGSSGNQCPTADAGPVSMAATVGQALALQGSASDPDNGPQPLVMEWTVSGPGTVSFGNKADPRTTATFSAAGAYVLRLWCSDGQYESSDTVTVVITSGTAGACELLAYWDFEEGSGVVAYDLSGRSHNGALFGGPQWVAGYDGGALKFDGVNDYVDTGITENLPKWSICCWVSSPAAPSADAPTGPIHRDQNLQINWNHGDASFRAAAALNVGGTWYAAKLKYAFVSHIDPDTAGSDAGMFPADVAFPNDVAGKDDDDFAVKVTGQLDIRADGVYQIGFNSDDGASLRITGNTWQSIVADGTGGAQISGDELINDAISGNTLTAGQISLKAGCHAFEAVMFERAGGSYFELLGRGVSNKGIADPTWHLLRSGDAQSSAQVAGLKLVWPAGMP